MAGIQIYKPVSETCQLRPRNLVRLIQLIALPSLQAKKRKAGPGAFEAERDAAASGDEDSDEEGLEQAALD